MKRREFFEKAGIGSAALATMPGFGPVSTQKTDSRPDEHDHGHDDGRGNMEGPESSADVSFGQWDLETPLDRFPNASPRDRNYHHLVPGTVTIRAGGSVNFIIAGFHHVLIYDNGTKPSDINIAATIPTTVQPGPPLINDPVKRIYRGLDPSVLPTLAGSTPPAAPPVLQDRVETVRFPNPGKFLVICGVLPHFFDAATGQFIMFGYVRVRR